MAKPAPIIIPTEPIGSIPKPADLIDRVAKGDASDLLLRSIRGLRPQKNYGTIVRSRGESPVVLRGRFISD